MYHNFTNKSDREEQRGNFVQRAFRAKLIQKIRLTFAQASCEFDALMFDDAENTNRLTQLLDHRHITLIFV
jgi:hypothetical protein